jgi:hypothetical protein
MNKLSILVLLLSVSLIHCSTRQLRRTSLTVASDLLQTGVESLLAEDEQPLMMSSAPQVEELTPEEEFDNFVESVTGGLDMFREQVQGFLKNLLEALKNDEMKGCVTDLGYWQQTTLDAIKNDQGLQDYVNAIKKPLVECQGESGAEETGEEELALTVEDPNTVEAESTSQEETAATAEEETAAAAEEETAATVEEETAAAVEEENVDPAPTVSGWGRRMQAPTPKETLDDVLDAWVDYVEETLVKGKECGDKWMEYGLNVSEIYENGWENNTGLYTLQTAQMNAMNDAWRACL